MLKIPDLVSQNIAIFIYKYHYQRLPLVFQNFFDALTSIHGYNTRQAPKKSYYIPKARTNYRIFNIRLQDPKIWNSIDEKFKSLTSLKKFKKKLKWSYLDQH